MADRLKYWMALHSVPGLGPVTFRRILRRMGGVERALEEDDAALAELGGLAPDAIEAVSRARNRLGWAQRALESLCRQGGGVSRPIDPDYPEMLKDLPNPPPLLYQIGQWRAEDRRAAAIVGATKPSARGEEIARGLAARLAKAGVTVVSGYARGVDSAAHLGALHAGGRTVLCLPHGIRQFEPRADWPPVADLLRQAAVLSEQPPDARWETQAALTRNRLIAALSRAVIVVESSPDGGAMNTFSHARALGRHVFAVRFEEPPDSAGGNALCLAHGAAPLERFRDVEGVVKAVAD